jgi:hypothetical protein
MKALTWLHTQFSLVPLDRVIIPEAAKKMGITNRRLWQRLVSTRLAVLIVDFCDCCHEVNDLVKRTCGWQKLVLTIMAVPVVALFFWLFTVCLFCL